MTTRNVVLALLALIAITIAILRACSSKTITECSYKFPAYNPNHPPPAGTPASTVFALSQEYPSAYSPGAPGPWTSINFQTNPAGYATAVLNYCLEGNTSIDFKVQNNTVRKWYHAPWLHYGENGREWRHGLTRERNSRPGELHPGQTATAFSWAVGFYNEPGGYTIGKVWPDCGQNIPVPSASNFPEGTVGFKLLFSSATDAQVPYLRNSLTWTANTGPINAAGLKPGDPGWQPRTDHTMRLLQVDIIVKDNRSPIGWVFGTFVYDGYAAGATVWERLTPVGLSWGNDPGVTAMMNNSGVFINPGLSQSWINASLLPAAGAPVNAARVYHLGLGGRLNGPVDNLVSSCTSCHGKAAVLKDLQPDPIENIGRNPRMIPSGVTVPSDMTSPKFNDFFGTNIPAGSGDITYNCYISGLNNPCGGANPSYVFTKTDYSLQLAVGIENYFSSVQERARDYLQQQAETKRQ